MIERREPQVCVVVQLVIDGKNDTWVSRTDVLDVPTWDRCVAAAADASENFLQTLLRDRVSVEDTIRNARIDVNRK